MPRKPIDDRRYSTKDFKFKGYLNYDVSRKEKEAYKLESIEPAELIDALSRWADSGFKVAVQLSPNGQAVKVSMTDIDTERSTCGYMISQQARTIDRCLFAHFHMFQTLGEDAFDVLAASDKDEDAW